jgi:hypothetical protein
VSLGQRPGLAVSAICEEQVASCCVALAQSFLECWYDIRGLDQPARGGCEYWEPALHGALESKKLLKRDRCGTEEKVKKSWDADDMKLRRCTWPPLACPCFPVATPAASVIASNSNPTMDQIIPQSWFALDELSVEFPQLVGHDGRQCNAGHSEG